MSNFKLGQLLETYLEEVAKDSSISLGKFITLADLFAEFPRNSDDGIYRAIDTFLRVIFVTNQDVPLFGFCAPLVLITPC